MIEVNERLLAHVFERVGGPSSSSCRSPRDRPTTRRCAASAPTGPTCASASSWSTSTDALRETEFKVFRSVARRRRRGRAGSTPARRELPRSELDGLIARAQELGAKGLVWAFREGDGWRSPTAKFLSEEELRALNERLGAEEGDLLLVVADEPPGRQRRPRPAARSTSPSAST